MEFWEGAILVIGGIWLVGRMSRASKSSPLNSVSVSASALGTVGPQGNTVATNTDGSSSLIAGEPLTPSAPQIPVNKTVSVNPVTSAPIRSPVLANPVLKAQPKTRVLDL